MNRLVQNATVASAAGTHQPPVPHWLTHLGPLGLFSIAVIDSSVIPLPLPGSTDLLLLWLVAHSGDPWLLAPCAIAGSMLGGYTTWHIGRRGGEGALRHYVPARLLGRIRGWVKRHRILAVFLPAPTPHPPLALCACSRGAGRLAPSLPRCLWCGAHTALHLYCMAWRDLRTQDREHVVGCHPEVVDSIALRVRGPARCRRLLRDMEGPQPGQGRGRRETRAAWYCCWFQAGHRAFVP